MIERCGTLPVLTIEPMNSQQITLPDRVEDQPHQIILG